MKSKLPIVLMTIALLFMATATQAGPEQVAPAPAAPVQAIPEPSAGGSTTLDRSSLPIKEPTYPVITELDARKATAPARFEVKPPAKAPNVVVILIDDFGFGHSSAFGGPY